MWKNIQINKQNIDFETGRATLIKCPNNSDYAGWKFWHPSKLIRTGKNSYALSLGYTDDFKFKLFKNGNGKWNKNEVIAEKEISIAEFENMFRIMNENISAPIPKQDSFVRVTEPAPINIRDVEIEECLKNN